MRNFDFFCTPRCGVRLGPPWIYQSLLKSTGLSYELHPSAIVGVGPSHADRWITFDPRVHIGGMLGISSETNLGWPLVTRETLSSSLYISCLARVTPDQVFHEAKLSYNVCPLSTIEISSSHPR